MRIRNILALLGIVVLYVFIRFIAHQVRNYNSDSGPPVEASQYRPPQRYEGIKLTPRAAARLREMASEQRLDLTRATAGIRVRVSRDSKGVFQYSLNLGDEPVTKYDNPVNSEGIRIFVDTGGLPPPYGLSIDYVTTDGQSRFAFNKTQPQDLGPVR